MHGVKLTGLTAYVQAPPSPACATLNVRAPTVMVAVRASVSKLRSTAKETVPSPVPGLPPVTWSQGALLAAVHAQWPAAMTEKLPAAGSLSYDAVPGAMSSVQGWSPSSCTVTACPPIVSVPVRAVSVALAPTATFTTPLPVPDAPLVIDIQPRSDTAVHEQWLAAATVTAPVPPAAPNVSPEVESWMMQAGGGETGVLLLQLMAVTPTTGTAINAASDFHIARSTIR